MTEHYHYLSWMYTLKKLLTNDFFIDYDTYISKFHTLNETGIRDYLIELGILDWEDACILKTDYLLKCIQHKEFKLELNLGCEELLNKIIINNKKFVIVSNSPRNLIESILNIFPILQKAERIYSKEFFTHKKPHPECYLKIASEFSNLLKIGFEDSLTGITALMQVPSITPVFINKNTYPHYKYIISKYKSLIYINSFNELI